MAPILDVQNLQVFYGHIHALKGIDLHVNEGEIVTLIGSNGAGKTTTLRAISNLLKTPEVSHVLYDGVDITHLRPHEIVDAWRRARTRRAPCLLAHERAGEPGDGRLHAQERQHDQG